MMQSLSAKPQEEEEERLLLPSAPPLALRRTPFDPSSLPDAPRGSSAQIKPKNGEGEAGTNETAALHTDNSLPFISFAPVTISSSAAPPPAPLSASYASLYREDSYADHNESAGAYVVPQTAPPNPDPVRRPVAYNQSDFASAYTYSRSAAAARATDAATAILPKPSAIASTTSAGTASSNTARIEDVIAENARLRAEIERLTSGARTHSGVGAVVTSIQQQQHETSAPPEGGVKYVCCGGCRQWLIAPTDSVFVYCPQCKCINNCNLPSNTDSTRIDRDLGPAAVTTYNPISAFVDEVVRQFNSCLN